MAEPSSLWAYGKICRLEYLKGEAPAVFLPALFTASTVGALTAPPVVEGVAVFALLYVTGFIANALSDRALDLKYASFKHDIGRATAFLGPAKVKAVLVLHLAAALALTVHLSLALASPVPFALVSLGIFLALAYSLPPFHLKVRGIAAHAFGLALSAFALPFLFLYFVASGGIDAHGWTICAAFTLTHYALTYTNQAYDFDEDEREGVLTPPVRLGLLRCLQASFLMLAVGLPALTFSLVGLALDRDTVSAAWGGLGAAPIALGTSGLLWLGYRGPLRGLARMQALARAAAPCEADAVPQIRKEVDYASFHASGIASLAVFGVLLFALTFQAEVAVENEGALALHFGPVDRSWDLGGASGPTASFSAAVVNDGPHTMPAGVVSLRVAAREKGQSASYLERTLTLPAPLGPHGATQVDVPAVPLHLLAGGCEVTLTLLLDGDRDGQNLREVAATTLSFPT